MADSLFKSFRWLNILLIAIGFSAGGAFASCPSLCTCDLWFALKRASCNGRHLYSVHTGAAHDLQALDLSDNSVSIIADAEIAEAGLTKLKFLNLSNNAINEIGLEGFAGLADLAVLDLSGNHLHYLLDEVFLENRNLRVVRLSGNNFDAHVPRLKSSSITDLSLGSCQISHLPAGTFDELPKIRYLDISGNMMIQLEINLLRPLQFLRKISLNGNPWSCDNAMRDLRRYFQAKRVEFAELCSVVETPRKFEKMILPRMKEQRRLPARISNVTRAIPKTKNSTRTEVSREIEKQSFSVPAYWVFLAGIFFGIIIGAGSTLAIFSCCQKRRISGRSGGEFSGGIRRQNNAISAENSGFNCRQNSAIHREISEFVRIPSRSCRDPQRISLLGDSINFADNSSPSCPGTPPPSYRDVIFRPSLFPRAH